MRISLIFLFIFTLAAGGADGQKKIRPAASNEVSEVPLGEGIVARIGFENSVKLLYLPGRASAVGIPFGIIFNQAVVSPDRKLVVFLLSMRRSDNFTDYFACLVCRRSDTTPVAQWTVNYALLGAALELKFDLRTWVEKIHAVSNEGVVTLKLGQNDKLIPPSRVLRSWEDWNLEKEERINRIKDAGSDDDF